MPTFYPSVFKQSVFRRSQPRSSFEKPAFSWDFTKGILPKGFTLTRASSGTYLNSAGVLTTAATNEARFDYDPLTLQPRGLLIEGARTNLFLNSADVAAAFPTNTATTVTADATVSPDGTVTGDQITRAGGVSAFRTYSSVGTLGQSEVFSQFVKADGSGGLWGMRIVGTYPNRVDAVFDLSNGTVSFSAGSTWAMVSATIQNVGNGWYRCSLIGTSATTAKSSYQCGPTTIASAAWEGGGSGACGAYVWGSQGEANALFASSYIPTTTAAATRADDAPGAPTLNIVGFTALSSTFVANFELRSIDPTVNRVFEFGVNSSNRSGLEITPSICRLFCVSGGAATAFYGTRTITAGSTIKTASAWEANNFGHSVNGQATETDVAGALSVGPTSLRLGYGFTDAFRLHGWFKTLDYYPARLTNTELPIRAS